MNKVAIIGSVGLPAKYGGFETLVSNLVKENTHNFSVYCSSCQLSNKPKYWNGCMLHYFPLPANGFFSIFYDIVSCLHASFYGYRKLLILGVSGTTIFPFIRFFFPKVEIFVNVDGIEWRRQKWNMLASIFLRFSEFLAARFAHHVIADNKAIEIYLRDQYSIKSTTIAYGGDTFLYNRSKQIKDYILFICRIEPENNIDVILEAVYKSKIDGIFVGNWENSKYGRNLRNKFDGKSGIICMDPVYDPDELSRLRSECLFYIHGHSAGGTNPSLVEIMFYGKRIIAYDCDFNRYTLGGFGLFFKNSNDILSILNTTHSINYNQEIVDFAFLHYSWRSITKKYYKLLKL